MSAQSAPDDEAVRKRLDRVTDPELDRSIIELGYVDAVERDGDRVTVRFTLPTAWCSPAFAWMMATDARDEVETLSGIGKARIVLREHMHDEEITVGVNERLPFEEVFPDAEGGIDEVRATLDDKARLARQHDATETMLEAGLRPEQIVELTRGDVDIDDDPAAVYLADDAFAVTVPRDPIVEYLEKAEATGRVAGPGDRLFLTPEGDSIPPEQFELVRRRTRLAQVNMSGQGGICEGLNEARRKRLDRVDAD